MHPPPDLEGQDAVLKPGPDNLRVCVTNRVDSLFTHLKVISIKMVC